MKGKVVQVIGPVLDVEFPEGHLHVQYWTNHLDYFAFHIFSLTEIKINSAELLRR